jgi:PAS domain S-box-containing protein
MNRLIRLSLRARLMALVLLALLPAFALIIYNTLTDYRKATEEAKNTAQRLAWIAAQHHEQMIDDAYELVTLLTRLPLLVLGPQACQNLMTNLPDPYPEFASVVVLNQRGTVLCATRPKQSGMNYSDRRWFQEVVGSRKFIASESLIGRMNTEPNVVFAAPMLDGNGAVQAVVGLAVNLDWVNRLSARTQVPAGSTFTLLDARGIVLARQPEAEWIGASYPKPELVRAILRQKGAGTMETVQPDGAEHLYAFHPLGGGQGERSWYLAVGIPKAAAYREMRAMMTQNLLFMGLVAVLVLATAWWGSKALVLRPIRALADTSAKLGKGDLSARTGMGRRRDEIGRLAGAFDDMAEAIQARESDRRGAEQIRAQLAAIVESSSDAIISRTLDGFVTSWNKGAERLFGYRADEMIGTSILRLIPDGEMTAALDNFARIKNGERINSYEAVRLHKSGAAIDVSVTTSPIIDERGMAIGASSITRDISARKRAENELRALHDINLAISSTLDRRAVLQMLLEKIEVLLPYAASHIRLWSDATGKLDPVACSNLDEEQWKAGDASARHAVLRTILRSKRPLVIDDLQTDERISRGSFYRRHGLVSYLGMPLIVKDQAIGVLSLLTKEKHDFTEREIRFVETLAKQASIAIYNSKLYEESRKLLDNLALSERQIRALANGLMRAQDEEARRIAHVLHDESGQFLAMVYISLDELAKSLSAADKERVEKIKSLLDEVEERLRDLSHELYPAMLDHLGLVPSLEYLASQIAKRTGMQIAVEANLPERLSPLLELTIYRVVQEGFNNVVRHANAAAVSLRLLQDDHLVQCAIQDDGVGFDPCKSFAAGRKPAHGLGLPGMRERVEAAGGTFEILSAPGAGTKLFLSIPREKIHGIPDPAG